MYPRNAASPEPIAIGPVVQISDGAVQTSGVTVRVKPTGVAEADGGGTTAYSSDGVVLYTPTQAETNYTSFVLIAKKTGCIPASVTVVTSASNTTGYAGTDHSKILNPSSTVNLSGTSIKNATDNASQSSVDTLASYVDTEIAAIKAKTDLIQAFPTNFSLLMISGAGAIGLVDELGPQALSANSLEADIASQVWNTLTTGTFTDQSFGDRLLISTNNIREVAVNGNGHVAGVLHDAEPNSIPEDAFVTGSISARAIGTDAIDADALADSAKTEIANAVAATQALSRLDSMIESDGAGQFRFDTIALENAPAGGGGGGTDWTANERTAIRSILGIPASGTTPEDPSVGILDTIRDGVNSIGINVYPVTSSTPERVNGTTITVYKDEQTNVTISTTATLTGLTLRFVAEDRTGADVLVVENASFVARTATSATLQIPSTLTDEIANYPWTLRDVTTGNSVLARGVLSVQAAASKNA